MHGHKNIPSANPLFLALLWAHPILHVSRIRVNAWCGCILPETTKTAVPDSTMKLRRQRAMQGYLDGNPDDLTGLSYWRVQATRDMGRRLSGILFHQITRILLPEGWNGVNRLLDVQQHFQIEPIKFQESVTETWPYFNTTECWKMEPLQPGMKMLGSSLCVIHLLQQPLCFRLVKQQSMRFEVLGDESVVGWRRVDW